ncbi:hypothetical protein [Neobacillus sp. D3-1R]|uniref:hypothetical protein n=1 Tax=Neobacillus sp. D3-1R TaxID=3445778 RepID=UPI003FA0B433
MNSFFIVISLILNFVALFGIIILYLRQNRLFELEKKQDKVVKEMEEVISSYLLEIREDNEEFLEKIKDMNQIRNDYKYIPNQIKEENVYPSPEILVPKQSAEKMNELPIKPVQVVRSQVVNAYKKGHQIAEREKMEKSEKQNEENSSHNRTILEDIIILQKQGFSEEEIAKKLNKGKTEIQLLLKFRQDL